MKFTEWLQTHHRSILFGVAVLTLGGLVSALSLPVALFPQVRFPRVLVNVDSGDRPAERMATEVTWPVEEAVRSVPGVRTIRSNTGRGSAEIAINFDWGEDLPALTLQVESAVTRTMPELPPGTTFEVRLMDPTVFPVLGYSLVSDTRSLTDLRDIAQYDLRPILTTIPGVAKTEVLGGQVEEYRVEVDAGKLQAYNITLADVVKAVTAASPLTAVGRLEDHDKLYLVISDTSFTDMGQIPDTVVKSDSGGVVRLSQVATVRRDAAPQWQRVTADGHDAVLVHIYQQPGGNTVEIAKEVQARLAEFKTHLPKDVKIANWYDQSEIIVSSATSVFDAILIGVGLAVLILLLFLRNFKITLIAAIVVPSVLAVTVLMLYGLHMSFNIMTMGGMAAAVGLIIDDAIVLIEHIIRTLRSGTGDARQRVSAAVLQFTGPLSGSSASTIVIFTPLAFISGVTGAFFKALSLTMAASLLISYLVVYLAVPLLAMHLLKEKDTHQKEGGWLTDHIHRAYAAVMRVVLPQPWLVLLLVAPLLTGGYFAYINTGSGFMPKMDEGGFILDYTAPAGTSVTETDRMLRLVEDILHDTPEVDTYSRRTGLQLGGFMTEPNVGDFFVRLRPTVTDVNGKTVPRRPIDAVMKDVLGKVEDTVPGLEPELKQLMEDLIGDLTGDPEPVAVKIFCDDGKVLTALAPKVNEALSKVPGIVELKDIVFAGDALDITIDRAKAALEGIDPDAATTMLSNQLTGQVVTKIQRGSKMIDVRVWTPAADRASETAVREIPLEAPDGHTFPLRRIATVTPVIGQPEIMREDLKRMATVTARIEGRDMGSAIADVKKALEEPGLFPPNAYYTLGGLYEQQQIAFHDQDRVLVAAVLLVFLLLLFLYERFRVAFAILITTLLSTAAVFIGLCVTKTELNITSKMGLTMVVGIVTEVSIFYYSEYRELSQEGGWCNRLIQAGVNRMRPIAMTTVAAILALLPLALGLGGAAMQQPLAIAIIAGLTAQLPLALIVLPAILALVRPRSEQSGDYEVQGTCDVKPPSFSQGNS